MTCRGPNVCTVPDIIATWETPWPDEDSPYRLRVDLANLISPEGVPRVDAAAITITTTGPPITATVWRSVTPWTLVRDAIEQKLRPAWEAQWQLEWGPGSERSLMGHVTTHIAADGTVTTTTVGPGEIPADFLARRTAEGRRRHEALSPPTRRHHLTPELLAEVARVWIDATRRHRDPARAVAQHFKVPQSTAGRWIAKARQTENSLIPPSSRRRNAPDGGTTHG